jgi:hypothetical protein
MKKINVLLAFLLIAFTASSQVADDAVVQSLQNLFDKQELKGDAYSSESIKLLTHSKHTEQVLVFKGLDEKESVHLVFKRADATGTPIELTFALNHGSGIFRLFPPYVKAQNFGTQIEEVVAQQMVAAAGTNTAVLFSAEKLARMATQPNVTGLVFIPMSAKNKSALAVMQLGKNGQPLFDGTILYAEEIAMPYPSLLVSK